VIFCTFIGIFQDLVGRFATDFDGEVFQIQDIKTKKRYKITLSVKESSLRDFISNSKEKAGTFVLNGTHQLGSHCFYAAEWIEGKLLHEIQIKMKILFYQAKRR
jgi:hypothetical protein